VNSIVEASLWSFTRLHKHLQLLDLRSSGQRLANGSSGNIGASDTGASNFSWSRDRDKVRDAFIISRVLPKDIDIRKHVAASEDVDIVDSGMDYCCVIRIVDDVVEIVNDMRTKDVHQVLDCTAELSGCVGRSDTIDGRKCSQLAGLVLSRQQRRLGIALDISAEGKSVGVVQKGIHDSHIRKPLVDRGFSLSLVRIID